VWPVQILGLGAQSLAELGDNTNIVAQGPVTDYSIPERLVKDVVDLENAPSEGFVDGAVFWDIQLGEIAIRQEGVLLRVRIVGDAQQLLDAL